jgi:hypothetical protein
LVKIDYRANLGRLQKIEHRFLELTLSGRELWKAKLARLLGHELVGLVKRLSGFLRRTGQFKPMRSKSARNAMLSWRESLSAAALLTELASRSSLARVPQATRQKVILELAGLAERDFGAEYAEDTHYQLSVTLLQT